MSVIEFRIREDLYDCTPHPVPSKKMVPSWYKNMSQYVDETNNCPMHDGNNNLTMKSCIPIRDTLVSGYTLLLPADLIIETTDENIKVQWKDQTEDFVGSHSIKQIKGSPLEKMASKSANAILKINNPWRIYTKPGYSCHFTTPAYHDLPFEILPGIVDTDGIHEVNFPILWKTNEKHVLMKKGFPMVQIFPFKRESWDSKVVVQPEMTERKKQKNFNTYVGHWYRDFVHKKKSYK